MESSFEFDVDLRMLEWFSIPAMRMFFIAGLVVIISTFFLQQHYNSTYPPTKNNDNHRGTNDNAEGMRASEAPGVTVPFIVLEEPAWRDLSRMLENYRREGNDLLKVLSQSLELALHSERELGVWYEDTIHQQGWLFSDRLQNRIQRVSDCLDHNENQLMKLMQPFPALLALPSTGEAKGKEEPTMRSNSHYQHKDLSLSKTTRLFTLKQAFAGTPTKNGGQKNAYDCGAQVVAHIVRDWTVLGDPIRAAIYDWCRAQIEQYLPESAKAAPILVPGAGLGRLAHDISFVSGYTVEANEISLSMGAGARAILQQGASGSLYPFALDFFANEVEADSRYDLARFPDIDVTQNRTNANLSYTIGDFIDVYRWQRPRGSFAAVVTCFFIDTATNIYEYLATIEHSLAPGGIWINVGPLRWHANSMLHPASNELRMIIESPLFGFDIVKWSVDETPSEYRSTENESHGDSNSRPFVRSTAYDGYRPLRFVAVKRN